MTPPVDVEISLVNTNNRDLLSRCLASLSAACEDLRWHVTVVDNASSDGSADLVRRAYPAARLLRNDVRLGFSANHNQVLRLGLAEGARWVLVLNEDTELDPGSVASMVAQGDVHEGLGAIGPEIRGSGGERQPTLLRFPTVGRQFAASLSLPHRAEASGPPGWVTGACVLLRVAALREVGLLDERFFIFFEDTDIGLRLHSAGWGSGVCPAARILHLGHQTVTTPALGSSMGRQFYRSQFLYFRKHNSHVMAAMVASLVRAGLYARAFKSRLENLGKGRAASVAMLNDLASYDPRNPLDHESPRATAL